MTNLTQNQKYQNIIQRLQAANAVQKQKDHQAKEEARRKQEISSKVADDILLLLYERVKTEVYRSCGLPKEYQFTFYVETNLVIGDDVKMLIHERSGMQVTEVKTTQHYQNGVNKVSIQNSERAKRYTVATSPKHSEQELDFPALAEENLRRRAIWEEHVEEFAKECLRKCVHCLEVMPNKHYGIPIKDLLIIEEGKNPFCGSFRIADLEIEYRYLQKYQIGRLSNILSYYILDGSISIKKEGTQVPRFYIDKNVSRYDIRYSCHDSPEEKKQALFDYRAFHQQYDNHVTPELQKVLDDILHNIQLCDNTVEAYRALEYQPELVYCMEDSSATKRLMETAFDEWYGIHTKDLIVMLEREFSGIKISQIIFEQEEQSWAIAPDKPYMYYGYNRRIKFRCEAMEPNCQLALQILAIKQKIADLKGKNRHLIVDAVIDRILRLTNDLVGLDSGTLESFHSSGINLKLAIEIDGYEIRIDEVEDPEFIKLLAADVARETEGLIQIEGVAPFHFRFGETSQF